MTETVDPERDEREVENDRGEDSPDEGLAPDEVEVPDVASDPSEDDEEDAGESGGGSEESDSPSEF